MWQVPLVSWNSHEPNRLTVDLHVRQQQRYTQRPPRTFYFWRYLRRASFSLLMIVFSIIRFIFGCVHILQLINVWKRSFLFISTIIVHTRHETFRSTYFLSIFFVNLYSQMSQQLWVPEETFSRHIIDVDILIKLLCFVKLASKLSSYDTEAFVTFRENF